jgi:hypothetical protein
MKKSIDYTIVLVVAAAFLFAVAAAHCQTTTVTLQATDADGQSWNNGSWIATLYSPPGVPNGPFNILGTSTAVPNQTQGGFLSGTGGASLTLTPNASIAPAGTQWQFSFCPQATAACTQIAVTIVGATQTVAPALAGIRASVLSPINRVTAYRDTEITGANVGAFYLNLTDQGLHVCITAVSNQCTVWGGGGSGGGGGGSCSGANCFNATTYGASTTADNSVAFAAMTAAAMAQAKISVGTPTLKSVVTVPGTTGTYTSTSGTITLIAGDTGCVAIIGSPSSTSANITYSVTDPASNAYASVGIPSNHQPGAQSQQAIFYCTGVGAAKAASGTMTVTITSTPTTGQFGLVFMDWANVGSIGQFDINNFATSTTPANSTPTTTFTQDNNNVVLSAISFLAAGASNISANTGTLQGSWNGTAAILGGGVVSNTSATPAAVTTSATLSASSGWVMDSLELRSVQINVPTIYIPAGTYNYASGLNFPLPVTIRGEPGGGTVLCYNGTAHAMDIGATNYAGYGQQNGYAFPYWNILQLTFMCGGSATEGIFINNFAAFIAIKNNQWVNFGNTSANMAGIWANGNQNDLYIADNSWGVYDGALTSSTPGTTGVSRQWVNVTVNSINSTLRMTGNSAFCGSNVVGYVGCASTFGTTPPLISVLGLTHTIQGNNFEGGHCPVIQLLASDNNTKIENNHIEVNATCPAISFQAGVYGLRVTNNLFTMTGTSASPIGPITGTDTLTSAWVEGNVVEGIAATTPLVQLNNVAGQINNFSARNICMTGVPPTPGTVSGPCALTHTAGSNITQWNADYAPKLTFAAGTTASYTFGTVYSIAPLCVIPPNIPGTATTLTITTLSATTLTLTASASNSSTVNAVCNPEQ